ncbi:cyclophilin-like protein [Metschnikowia bicuspidata var. bicuspidata NRRL YB-4993]|uniref:Peptidyl-prolyl cis-trans isomerase n=1 Tax=Metschnikowia bicuspidata var. bicuspidata NRRL YB-4993 TaxID=869754 RepID=A0A1A0HHU1_9ASCO|nr:cyclophilin-like protein [Metschnikowia bicuspidata var. bicuspidata NRRL YB-4993]OBA23571.1 cyclophilin-like protein [Metschnikowia bicuspidata var. bicuspidata NRRL YB-4993]
MNPLRLLYVLALPLLALCTANLALAPEELKHLEGDPEVTHFAQFSIGLQKSETELEHLGDLKFALFGSVVPITVANFITSIEQEINGYTNSIIHRVVKGVIAQGGFLKKVAWKEYEPIAYERFPCENFQILHNKPGRISLASTQDDTNGMSFFISIPQSTLYFDNKYVVFGQLVLGFDVLQQISETPVNGETPIGEIVITKSVYMDPSSVPMVMDFGAVTGE